MPDWVAQLFLQFPVVGLVFVAVYYSTRYNDRRWKEFLERYERLMAENRDAVVRAITRLDAVEEKSDARHQAEIDRMRKAHEGHLRTLRAEIRRLEDQLRQHDDRKAGDS
jgi:hypothetical protein